MSVEERILNIAEAPNWYDGRELRTIALELRKMEDRIKQLEEMYEGEPGERPDLLGSNVMGLLKRELNSAQQRIKRLEEAGDDLYANCDPSRWDSTATTARKLSDQNAWRKAKEAKL